VHESAVSNSPNFAFSLQGELAIVTGGGTGLGFAMAQCFIAAGARVIITGRRADVLSDAASRLGPNAFFEEHDVTDPESSEALVERVTTRHGAMSILVNNAGNHVKRSIEETSLEDFRRITQTHVEGAFLLTKASVPHMKKAGGGSIIFTASMASIIGLPLVVAYSAAKSGIVGMVRSLASELGPSNIRVNAIAPGWITTPMLEQALSGDPERRNKILARTPQQRFGNPEDIGWCAVYLSSPAGSFINGIVMPVDGGASIGF
jgi:NAD(P)-dependent dehydrogenase (short-subunit alcohol dehydrogenase family)